MVDGVSPEWGVQVAGVEAGDIGVRDEFVAFSLEGVPPHGFGYNVFVALLGDEGRVHSALIGLIVGQGEEYPEFFHQVNDAGGFMEVADITAHKGFSSFYSETV